MICLIQFRFASLSLIKILAIPVIVTLQPHTSFTMLALLRRYSTFSTVRINPSALTCLCTFRLFSLTFVNGGGEKGQSVFSGDGSTKTRSKELFLSPLFSQDQSPLSSSEIKVVDSHTWQLSSGFPHVSKSFDYGYDTKSFCIEEFGGEVHGNFSEVKGELDLDEIEDMRIHGKLFYKIDRSSKEFEEYKFDFHRRKPRSSKDDGKEGRKAGLSKDDVKEGKKAGLSEEDGKGRKKAGPGYEPPMKGGKHLNIKEEKKERNKDRVKEESLYVNDENIARIIKDKYVVCAPNDDTVCSHIGNKQRKPTFNQLTGPYHEPFCLDIYISKESVRACVVHRVTSKVVAVAHSISKDLKFELGSTRNATACAAVGKVLAHRALADDIHDVIFTPRKGDKLEGKLQIVLQTIMDNGVNVKVKLKKRNVKKAVTHQGLTS